MELILTHFSNLLDKYPYLSLLFLALGIVVLVIYGALLLIEANTVIFAMYLTLALACLIIVAVILIIFLRILKCNA